MPSSDGSRAEPDVADGDEPLDQSRLTMLQSSGGGTDLVAELVELFVGDVPPRLDVLAGAIANGDAEALARAAHSLKGSSATMGAVGMSELCRRMEMLGRAGDVAPAAPLLVSLREEFERASRALHDWVSAL
jgi:HPt (histidine-containing phosphotransfer) domain-containing protein